MASVINSSLRFYASALSETFYRTLDPSGVDIDGLSLISRLPTELLQLIFEFSVLSSPDNARLREALLLSAVCRQWRWTAVDTPFLWATLDLDMSSDADFRRLFIFDLATTRMKSAQASVAIRGITRVHVIKDLFESYPIFELPQLYTLKLSFQDVHALNLFLDDTLRDIGHAGLKELDFVGCKGAWYRLAAPSLILTFEAFPSLTHLSLAHIEKVDLSGVVSETLLSFDMQHILWVYPEHIIEAFPNLESFQIQYTRMAVSHDGLDEQPKTMVNLRHLRVIESRFFQNRYISKLHCPRLISIYNASTPSDSLIDFVQRHPSISRLDSFLDNHDAVYCATIAPQLTHICLTNSTWPFVRWKEAGLDAPPFPNLKVLLIAGHYKLLSYYEFEELVRARFLPLSHPQSRLEDPELLVDQLSIVQGMISGWETEAWANHPLCAEATKQVTPYADVEGRFHLTLRWPEAPIRPTQPFCSYVGGLLW